MHVILLTNSYIKSHPDLTIKKIGTTNNLKKVAATPVFCMQKYKKTPKNIPHVFLDTIKKPLDKVMTNGIASQPI